MAEHRPLERPLRHRRPNRRRPDLHPLVFVQIGSRKAWISSATAHPDPAWVAQQARNFCMDLPDGDRDRALVLHDADTTFTNQFDILKAEWLRPKKLVPVSPNLNAYVERFIQTIQQECLDHFVVIGQAHLDYIVREFVRYYHTEWRHQGIGNVRRWRARRLSIRAGRSSAGRGSEAC